VQRRNHLEGVGPVCDSVLFRALPNVLRLCQDWSEDFRYKIPVLAFAACPTSHSRVSSCRLGQYTGKFSARILKYKRTELRTLLLESSRRRRMGSNLASPGGTEQSLKLASLRFGRLH
jgi:hypothetical protein